MFRKGIVHWFALGALLTASLFLGGCSDEGEATTHSAPPPLVRAMTVTNANVPVAREYVGQTAGSREVEVRARVSGILLRRRYVEGSFVHEGDALFEIDPEQNDASLQQSLGELARYRADMENARLEYDRMSALYEARTISAKERDDAQAAYDVAKANVQSAEANVRKARLNRGYNVVRAPISGVTSQEVRSEGSYVSLDDEQSGKLTTILQLDPLYVNFSIPGTEALRDQRLREKGALVEPKDGPTLRLKLPDGSVYERVGHITFMDSHVDPQTGTIRARGEFTNHAALLLPGTFVRVMVEGMRMQDAVVIPQRGVLFTRTGASVCVLDDKNIASLRPVELGETVGENVIVTSGLNPGERIVAEGVGKVRPGAPVSIQDEVKQAENGGAAQ